jgi:hypothetical protein
MGLKACVRFIYILLVEFLTYCVGCKVSNGLQWTSDSSGVQDAGLRFRV